MIQSSRPPIKSIALFAPNRSSLYINGLLGLKKAFGRRGIVAHVGWGYLDEFALSQFCDVFRPDAVLEIDRTRDNAPGMPKNTISIAWLQDWLSVGDVQTLSSTAKFGGSDLYYLGAKPQSIGVDVSKLPHWEYLLQATDPDIYFAEQVAPESDFSLIGYIPQRSVMDKLDTPLKVEISGWRSTDFGTVGMLVNALKAQGITWNNYDAAMARDIINRHVYSFLNKPRGLFGSLLPFGSSHQPPAPPVDHCVIPHALKYFIENETMRALARSGVVEQLLEVSKSLRLFGIGMWQTYPQFAAYYKGPAMTETEVRRIYRSTQINLHNAMTQMHSRALDCMACGSVIMVNKMLRNDASEPDCLRAHFEPGVEYFEYEEENLTEAAAELLADPEKRRVAGIKAAHAVRLQHTWSHRADQILDDLSRL